MKVESLQPEVIGSIAQADDFHIAPFREDGVTHGTPTWIWSVAVDGRLFVRAYNGINSRWYKSAMKQKGGIIQSAGKEYQVAFKAIEGDINEEIDLAYRLKYSSSPYLGSMIGKRAKAATVEVLPCN